MVWPSVHIKGNRIKKHMKCGRYHKERDKITEDSGRMLPFFKCPMKLYLGDDYQCQLISQVEIPGNFIHYEGSIQHQLRRPFAKNSILNLIEPNDLIPVQ